MDTPKIDFNIDTSTIAYSQYEGKKNSQKIIN